MYVHKTIKCNVKNYNKHKNYLGNRICRLTALHPQVIVVSTSLECTLANTAIWTNPDVAGLWLSVCGDEEVEAWREVVLDDGRLLHHPRGGGV